GSPTPPTSGRASRSTRTPSSAGGEPPSALLAVGGYEVVVGVEVDAVRDGPLERGHVRRLDLVGEEEVGVLRVVGGAAEEGARVGLPDARRRLPAHGGVAPALRGPLQLALALGVGPRSEGS